MVFLYNILWLVFYVLHVWFYRCLSLVQCSVVVVCTFLARHFLALPVLSPVVVCFCLFVVSFVLMCNALDSL